MCPSCIVYLYRRNPGHFPSIEEYQETLQRYPEPIWASVEQVLALEQEDLAVALAGYEAARLTRDAS